MSRYRKTRHARAAWPLAGHLMQCALCAATKFADPDRLPSDWRILEADGRLYPVCPSHFPRDGASKEEFARAYGAVLAALGLPRCTGRASASN